MTTYTAFHCRSFTTDKALLGPPLHRDTALLPMGSHPLGGGGLGGGLRRLYKVVAVVNEKDVVRSMLILDATNCK